ncbi:unnamed protein product [Rhizophagus irregularis]|nr:unnamed protein product [Rhizophagus irregularis]
MFGKTKSHGKSYQHKLNMLLLEFIITDSQPFHILKSVGFRKLLFALDPLYSIPCDKPLKNLITDTYKTGVNELLSLIVSSCKFISITTDLWTAKSGTGYIGITGYWMDENFKPYDVLIAIESILYPHTAIAISSYLEKYNMVNMRSQRIEDYRLEDKSERLQEVQNELNKKNQSLTENSDNNEPLESFPINILKNINEVPTCWNSKYNSWKRLIELKKPILRLNATLPFEEGKNDKLDGERLQKIMICEEEWILLNELCSLFRPFNEVTTYFSGVEYATVSSILPIIYTLKLIYKKKLKEKYDVEIDDLDNAEEIDDNENMKEILTDDSYEDNSDLSEDLDLDEVNNEPIIIRPHKHNLHKKLKKINYSETSRKSQSTSENTLEDSQPSQRESANLNQIIKRVLETIIKSLNYYWKEPD